MARKTITTQVAIMGAGPAGLMLSHLQPRRTRCLAGARREIRDAQRDLAWPQPDPDPSVRSQSDGAAYRICHASAIATRCSSVGCVCSIRVRPCRRASASA